MTHFSLANLNWFDYTLIAIILISSIISLFRGFVREAISLVILILAVIIGLKYAPVVGNWLSHYIRSETLRYFLGFVATFIVVLIAGAIISMFLHALIDTIGLGVFDHLLGVIFGVVRGILLVSVLLLFLKMSTWAQAHWLKESELAPKFKPLVTWLQSFLPKQVTDVMKWVDT